MPLHFICPIPKFVGCVCTVRLMHTVNSSNLTDEAASSQTGPTGINEKAKTST